METYIQNQGGAPMGVDHARGDQIEAREEGASSALNQREGALNHSNSGMRGGDGSSGEIVERFSIDEVLAKWVGEFGRAQIMYFALTSFAWSLEALHTLVTVFADKTPNWRCTHIDINHDNATGDVSSCISSSSMCGLAPSAWEWVRKHESTVSEWNLLCERSYMQYLPQSFFFIGYLLGAGLCGHLADSRLGRRGALVLTCMLNAVCGMLTAASPNYGVYTLLRTATGICSGGLGLTSFVLGTEVIGPSRRTFASMSALYFYPLGMLLLATLSAATSHYSWRIIYLVSSTPSVLYCLFILPLLPESPRWYLVRGRPDEAVRVLKSIAKKNGTTVPDGLVLFVEDQDNDDARKGADNTPSQQHVSDNTTAATPSQQHVSEIESEADKGCKMLTAHPHCQPAKNAQSPSNVADGVKSKEKTSSTSNVDAEKMNSKAARGALTDVFRRRDTRTRMIVLVVVWFASTLGYYTFNLNVGNIGTNLTMTVMLNASAEIPGYVVTTILLDRAGRRITLITTLLLGAICSILSAVESYELRFQTSPVFAFDPPLSTYSKTSAQSAPMPAPTSHVPAFYNNTASFQHPLTSQAQGLTSLVQLICSLVGLSSIAGTFNLLYLYTAELFPTVVRNAAVGLATQAGTVGAIMAPLVVLSAHTSTIFPFLIIGVASLLSAIMSVMLPETLDCPFHETFEGMRRAKDTV